MFPVHQTLFCPARYTAGSSETLVPLSTFQKIIPPLRISLPSLNPRGERSDGTLRRNPEYCANASISLVKQHFTVWRETWWIPDGLKLYGDCSLFFGYIDSSNPKSEHLVYLESIYRTFLHKRWQVTSDSHRNSETSKQGHSTKGSDASSAR